MTEKDEGTLRRQLRGGRAGTVVAAKAVYTPESSPSAGLSCSRRRGSRSSTVRSILWATPCWPARWAPSVAGVTATIYGRARSQRQGSTIGNAIFLLFAFAGGSQCGESPRRAARRLSLLAVPLGQQRFRSVAPGRCGSLRNLAQAAMLAGLGAVLLVVGARLLDRRLLRGETA